MSLGFVDKRRGRATLGASPVLSNQGNYAGVAAMRTRLAAINGTYWTTARLNATNENDLTYALRLADDAAGVK